MGINIYMSRSIVTRKFDRQVRFDELSRNYPIRADFEYDYPRSYTWRCSSWLDQGKEGACTGFAVTHEAAGRPVEVLNLTEQDAKAVYYRAREIDEWPGEDYEGSSVLAAIKAGKEKGWYKEYRWAFGVKDLAIAVSRHGPAVLGVTWYSDMFDTDKRGFIHASGDIMGGHAILCHGFNVKGQYFKLHNSWGSSWGNNGECKISYTDMNKLLKDRGEAVIPTIRLR
jgi:hypothetical protein